MLPSYQHHQKDTNVVPISNKCSDQSRFPVFVILITSFLLKIDAADAESPLKESELQVLRSQYLKEQEAQHVTVQTKFNYAWGLIKSDKHNNQLEGVKFLTGPVPRCPALAHVSNL